MQSEKTGKLPTAGGISLLTIFSVLCLVVFAVLAVATLQADRRLFDSLSENVTGFYEADVTAQEMLRDLREGIQPEGVESLNESNVYQTYTYQVPVSEVQSLDCVVRIYPDSTYEITKWNLVRTVDWEGNFDTPVFTD